MPLFEGHIFGSGSKHNVLVFRSTTLVKTLYLYPVLRMRMDTELLTGSRSGIIVQDPDPAKSERADNCEFWTFCTVGLKYEIENGK